MLQQDIIIYENEDTFHINDYISKLDNFPNDFSKSTFYITNPNFPKNIELKQSSIKRIFSNGQLNPNKYIQFYFNKKPLTLERRKKEKENNEETTEDEEESTATIKEDEDALSSKNLTLNKDKEKDKQAILLELKNRNENIFNPNLPLLQNRIQNTFSNLDTLPQKYINLIILCNKITISLDYLKCLYLTVFFCGLLNLIYFLNILLDKNTSFENLYQMFCFPLALILMMTGSFGYKKAKENIYDNTINMRLTYLSCFFPIGSFGLSKMYMKRNFMMNIGINFISSFFSFLCIIILKEVERVKNSEKIILQV